MLTDLDTEIEPNQSHFWADFMELSPYFNHAASLSADSATFSNVHVYFFLLLCLPKALHYHLTVYKHVCMVGNTSISANRRICGFTHIQVCCVRKGLIIIIYLKAVHRAHGGDIAIRLALNCWSDRLCS